MREKDINGNYVENPIGYCMYYKHEGALSKELAFRKKCIAKKCKHFKKSPAYRVKQRYTNKRYGRK